MANRGPSKKRSPLGDGVSRGNIAPSSHAPLSTKVFTKASVQVVTTSSTPRPAKSASRPASKSKSAAKTARTSLSDTARFDFGITEDQTLLFNVEPPQFDFDDSLLSPHSTVLAGTGTVERSKSGWRYGAGRMMTPEDSQEQDLSVSPSLILFLLRRSRTARSRRHILISLDLTTRPLDFIVCLPHRLLSQPKMARRRQWHLHLGVGFVRHPSNRQ